MSVLKNCDNGLFEDMVIDALDNEAFDDKVIEALDDVVFPVDTTFERTIKIQNSTTTDSYILAPNGQFIKFLYSSSGPQYTLQFDLGTGLYMRMDAGVTSGGDVYKYIGTNIPEIRGPPIFEINNSSGEKIYFDSDSIQAFIGNTLRFSIDADKITTTHSSILTPTSFSLYNGSGESVGFTSTTVTLATDSVTRLTVSSAAITSTVGILLPTSGGTATALDYYEELQITATNLYNIGSVTQACTTAVTPILRFRRIGKLVTMDFNLISGTKSAAAAGITVAVTIPSRFYPINNSVILLTSISSAGVFAVGSMEVTTTGVVYISPTPAPQQAWNANTAFTVQKNCMSWATS